MQDLGFCSPTGTSCSLNLTAIPSNCSVSCDGFYGDISHIKDNDQDTKKDISKLEELKREYSRYKARLALNLEFDSSQSSTFGEFPRSLQSSQSSFSARTKNYKPLQLVQIYFDTATFDRIERDVKNTLETQISTIGGTMGLLTGDEDCML